MEESPRQDAFERAAETAKRANGDMRWSRQRR